MKKNIPVEHIFSFILFLLSGWIIYSFPNIINSDQICIGYDLSSRPAFTDGIMTFFMMGLYNKLIHPSLEVLNTHMRIFSMLLFMGAAYGVAVSLLRNKKWAVLFLVILITSRFPFLWLSRELISGALVSLAFIAFLRKWNPFAVCLTIFLMGHAKPELFPVAFIFLGVLIFQIIRPQDENSKKGSSTKKLQGSQLKLVFGLIVFYFGMNFLILAPEMLNTKKVDVSRRPFVSFAQHYSDLVDQHQMTPTENGFGNWGTYMSMNFPGANNIKDVITQYPKKYYDFAWLSIGHGVKRAGVLFHFFLLFIFVIWVGIKRKAFKLDLFYYLFFISLLGAAPFILFSYPHIRYLARYYPLAILGILYFVENCKDKKIMQQSYCLLAVAVLVNIVIFVKSWGLLESGSYWFPD